MSKRAEKRALELFPVDMQMCIDSTGGTYEADVNAQRRKYVAFGYVQAEKDMMLEMRQWILRQRGFGKVALQDFEKHMRGNGHE